VGLKRPLPFYTALWNFADSSQLWNEFDNTFCIIWTDRKSTL